MTAAQESPNPETAPIRKRIEVPLPPDAAFDLFTRDIATWWPGDTHSLSAADNASPRDIRVEPFEGGRILESTHDGQTLPWATVTDWSPGRRFAADWYVGRPEADATQLELTFTPIGGGTAIDLTHSGFDRLAAAGNALCARYQTGWDHVLGRCRRSACAAQAA